MSEIQSRLRGPIPSLRTPFTREGEIDFASLRGMIEFDIENGAQAVMLTFGDSLYSLLTDEEVGEVTRIVVEQTAGRALVIAADRGWATPKCVQFADYCRDIGADILMVMPPDWTASCTPRTLTDHYAAVASRIPVMLVSNVFIPRGLGFAMETLTRVREEVQNVVAVKDDWCDEFGRKLSLLAQGHWTAIAGGQKQNHLNAFPYGCDSYLSTFLTFNPSITHDYWSYIERSDLPAAAAIVRDYDLPFFDHIIGLPGGFDAGMHAILELAGLASRWRRSPYYSLDDAEMESLEHFLTQRNLL